MSGYYGGLIAGAIVKYCGGGKMSGEWMKWGEVMVSEPAAEGDLRDGGGKTFRQNHPPLQYWLYYDI